MDLARDKRGGSEGKYDQNTSYKILKVLSLKAFSIKINI